jgi:hypothetical protein
VTEGVTQDLFARAARHTALPPTRHAARLPNAPAAILLRVPVSVSQPQRESLTRNSDIMDSFMQPSARGASREGRDATGP